MPDKKKSVFHLPVSDLKTLREKRKKVEQKVHNMPLFKELRKLEQQEKRMAKKKKS